MSLVFDDLQNQMKQITSISAKSVKKESNVEDIPDVDEMIEEDFDMIEDVTEPDVDSLEESDDFDEEIVVDDLDKF